MLLVLLKAGVLNTRVAVCHAGYEAFRSCCLHPCFHSVLAYGQFRKLNAFWSYCMPRINCLDEHKRASFSYKSICFLSCAEIIPERHLTAPEGPSEERQLETCCGNWWHWIAPRPLLKRFFGKNRDCLVDWKSSSLAVASSAGSGCLCCPCPCPTQKEWAQNSCQNFSQVPCPFFQTCASTSPKSQSVNLAVYCILDLQRNQKVFWGVFFPN